MCTIFNCNYLSFFPRWIKSDSLAIARSILSLEGYKFPQYANVFILWFHLHEKCSSRELENRIPNQNCINSSTATGMIVFSVALACKGKATYPVTIVCACGQEVILKTPGIENEALKDIT